MKAPIKSIRLFDNHKSLTALQGTKWTMDIDRNMQRAIVNNRYHIYANGVCYDIKGGTRDVPQWVLTARDKMCRTME